MKTNIWLLFLLPLLATNSTAAQQSAAELFSQGPQFSALTLSPTGDYLAVKIKHDGKDKLVVLDSETLKQKHVVYFADNAQVGDYAWVNDERLVIAKEYLKGWDARPIYYGELMAVNADGSKPLYLFGYNSGEQQTGSHINKNTAIEATAYILDPLPDNARSMLVSAIPWGGNVTADRLKDIYEVDVYKGTRKRKMTAPIGNSRFLTDNDGNVRIAVGENRQYETQVFYRQGSDWVNTKELGLHGLQPISFAGDPNTIYATGSQAGEPDGVYKVNLLTGDKQLIINDPSVEASHYWINPQSRQLYAVEFENGYPAYAFVAPDDAHAQYVKQLLQALPGYQVRIVSESRAGDKLAILAFNDTDAGEYYLFYPQQNKLRPLMKVMDGIDTHKTAEVKPITFKNRDGIDIQAYLTLPFGKEAKQLPLIVNPHGGPHFVRDYWQFDPQNQYLAAHGYAVLQVNYRGSGGYGESFQAAGYKKWGTNIQYDIIDGTQYVIAQGIADKAKVCIVGGSFGGYSALQSAEIAPDLFKCAVGVAGVYDLPLMFDKGDVQKSDIGTGYLKQVLGEDMQQLADMSPARHVDKLKAQLLLVHGGNDERAPLAQFEALENALKKQQYPYQKMIIEDEGHGFYRASDRAAYFQTLLQFLDKNLQQ